jgi:hypothetical protein
MVPSATLAYRRYILLNMTVGILRVNRFVIMPA